MGIRIKDNSRLGEKGDKLLWSDTIKVLRLQFHADKSEDQQVSDDVSVYLGKMSDICTRWSKRKLV